MFGLADLDKDGVVDFEEFVVMQVQKQERVELQQSEDRKLGAARALPAPVTT